MSKATKPSIVTRLVNELVNELGETYFCKVQTDNPALFVRGLWVAIDEFNNAHKDSYFMGELTDRMRNFRTTVSRGFNRNWEVCIRTHAWSPADDKRELHVDVLEYLRKQGLSVSSRSSVDKLKGDFEPQRLEVVVSNPIAKDMLERLCAVWHTWIPNSCYIDSESSGE